MTSEIIQLGTIENAFSQGGNRLCFIHPEDPNRCIKTLRADRTPDIKRAEANFPKNMKPLKYFNDNLQEAAVYDKIDRCVGEPAYKLIPRCYGFVDTNLGPGLCSDMVRDDDGLISITMKQYIWTYGKNAQISQALQTFGELWGDLGMPSRQLLLHNLVVRCIDSVPARLYLIDGLGWPDMVPVAYWSKRLARKKAHRRVNSLHRAIDNLLSIKHDKKSYGPHGWLLPQERRTTGQASK